MSVILKLPLSYICCFIYYYWEEENMVPYPSTAVDQLTLPVLQNLQWACFEYHHAVHLTNTLNTTKW